MNNIQRYILVIMIMVTITPNGLSKFVSFFDLIANTKDYSGQIVTISGYLQTPEDDVPRLYYSSEDLKLIRQDNSICIEIAKDTEILVGGVKLPYSSYQQLNQKFVHIVGKVKVSAIRDKPVDPPVYVIIQAQKLSEISR